MTRPTDTSTSAEDQPKPRTAEECEALIDEMTDALVFAFNFWTWKGEMVSGVGKTPIRWFASILEKAGIKYDADDITALHYPAKEKHKYFAEKRKQKKQKKEASDA